MVSVEEGKPSVIGLFGVAGQVFQQSGAEETRYICSFWRKYLSFSWETVWIFLSEKNNRWIAVLSPVHKTHRVTEN